MPTHQDGSHPGDRPLTSPVIGGCLTVGAEVTITYGDPPPAPCDVPNMIGLTWADAQDAWTRGLQPRPDLQGNNAKTVKEQTPNHTGWSPAMSPAGEVMMVRFARQRPTAAAGPVEFALVVSLSSSS